MLAIALAALFSTACGAVPRRPPSFQELRESPPTPPENAGAVGAPRALLVAGGGAAVGGLLGMCYGALGAILSAGVAANCDGTPGCREAANKQSSSYGRIVTVSAVAAAVGSVLFLAGLATLPSGPAEPAPAVADGYTGLRVALPAPLLSPAFEARRTTATTGAKERGTQEAWNE